MVICVVATIEWARQVHSGTTTKNGLLIVCRDWPDVNHFSEKKINKLSISSTMFLWLADSLRCGRGREREKVRIRFKANSMPELFINRIFQNSRFPSQKEISMKDKPWENNQVTIITKLFYSVQLIAYGLSIFLCQLPSSFAMGTEDTAICSDEQNHSYYLWYVLINYDMKRWKEKRKNVSIGFEWRKCLRKLYFSYGLKMSTQIARHIE